MVRCGVVLIRAVFAGFMVWLRLFAVWWFACVVWSVCRLV